MPRKNKKPKVPASTIRALRDMADRLERGEAVIEAGEMSTWADVVALHRDGGCDRGPTKVRIDITVSVRSA